jgi:hypothetical protein
VTQPTAVPRTAGDDDPSIPGTRELPVDLPGVPSTGATAVTAADEVLPTGPVGFVPGLPGAGTPPPPPGPAARAAEPSRPQEAPATAQAAKAAKAAKTATRTPGNPRRRAAAIGTGIAVLGVVLLEVGLLLGFGTRSLWSSVTLWSAFATLAALLVFLPVTGPLLSRARLRLDTAWRVAAGGLTGVAVFWVLVVLPAVDSDRGFVLTAALAALGTALWVAPARRA